jgi:hypothetical protein
MNYMTSPLNVASWGMQIASIPLGFINPWLGVAVGLGGYALGQFGARYIYRFDEIERTRQMLSVHFQNWTRMGYKGMDVSEAAKANFAIIEASLDSATFGIAEMRDIAAKISQTNLLGGLRTVEDFKQRFKQLVGVLREITGALHITYDEAIQLVSERVANGMTPEDVAVFSYRTRNIAAAAGVNPAALTRNMESTAQMLTQYGLSLTAGTNLAGLSYTILGAAKNVMPASQYNALNLEGRQEPISQSLNELFTRLVTNNTMFQLALIGAQSLGGTPTALENADFLKLAYAGQLEAANNWALLRREGRMGRISEILAQNPMLVFETTKKYIEYLASAMPGVEKNEAMKQTLMGLGITNPEYAQTVAKLLEQLPTGATQLFGLSLASQADIERLRDEAIQKAQDQMMSFWKHLLSNLAFWQPNWIGWRTIAQQMADRAARQGQELFFQQYGWAYRPGLYGMFFTPSLGKAGFEALFGPTGFQPVGNPQLFAQEAGIKAITPQEYLSIVASAYGTNVKQLYSGLAALATYGTYALPEFQVPGMSQADVERLRAFAGAGRALFTYLTDEDIKKVKETRASLEERIKKGEAVEVKFSPYQTLRIDPQQWRSFSEELKEAIATALVAQGLKMDEVINRIAVKMSERQSTPAGDPTLQKILFAYTKGVATEEQIQEAAKQLEEALKSDPGFLALSASLAQYKDKLDLELVRGIAAGDEAAILEAKSRGIPEQVVAQLKYAIDASKGRIEPILVTGLKGVDIIRGGLVPENLLWNPEAIERWRPYARETRPGVISQEFLQPAQFEVIKKKWAELKEQAKKDQNLSKLINQIVTTAETVYKEDKFFRPYEIGLDKEDVEALLLLFAPGVRETIEKNPSASIDTIFETIKRTPTLLDLSELMDQYMQDFLLPYRAALRYEMYRTSAARFSGLTPFLQNPEFSMNVRVAEPIPIVTTLFGLNQERLNKLPADQRDKVYDAALKVAEVIRPRLEGDYRLSAKEMSEIVEQLSSGEYIGAVKTFLGAVIGDQRTVNAIFSNPETRQEIIRSFVELLPFLPGEEKSWRVLRQKLAETYADITGDTGVYERMGYGKVLRDVLAKFNISETFSDLENTTSKVNQTLSQFNDILEKTNKKMSEFTNKLNEQNAPSAPQRTQDVLNKFSGRR